MKSLTALTAQDLLSHPVWSYTGENDAVATVTPSPAGDLREDMPFTVIVRTDFTLNNGTHYLGYCSPTDPTGLDYVQPVLLDGARHIRFHLEPDNDASSGWTALGLPLNAVFPVRWLCAEKVDGKVVSGSILPDALIVDAT
jgi:hypothetical protein